MVCVLGLGNVLMGDDGFGPAVVRALEEEYLVGPGAQLIDLGTPGLDLTPWLADIDRAIIIDTVKSDLAPGTLRVFDKAELLRHAPASRVGPHDPGVKEALLTLEFAGRAPRQVTLVGIVPAPIEMSLALTPQVGAMVAPAAAMVAMLLRDVGVSVTRREHPLHPASCWTAGCPAMSDAIH